MWTWIAGGSPNDDYWFPNHFVPLLPAKFITGTDKKTGSPHLSKSTKPKPFSVPFLKSSGFQKSTFPRKLAKKQPLAKKAKLGPSPFSSSSFSKSTPLSVKKTTESTAGPARKITCAATPASTHPDQDASDVNAQKSYKGSSEPVMQPRGDSEEKVKW